MQKDIIDALASSIANIPVGGSSNFDVTTNHVYSSREITNERIKVTNKGGGVDLSILEPGFINIAFAVAVFIYACLHGEFVAACVLAVVMYFFSTILLTIGAIYLVCKYFSVIVLTVKVLFWIAVVAASIMAVLIVWQVLAGNNKEEIVDGH